MNTDTQLATTEPSVALMLKSALDQGITKDNADALGKMMELYERMQDRSAEQQFNSAFNKLQGELPVIIASSLIPNRGKYERFEDVMRQIQPALSSNGFSVSFSQSFADGRIIETCKLKHTAGHSESNSFGVRLGGKADSETQADCKASTTAKRNALLNALNIVIRQDVMQSEDDPHNESGTPVTQAQADQLRELCDDSNSDRKKFLAYAAADEFEKIQAHRFIELSEILTKRLRSK
jgi:hypothetical protein